MAARRVQIDAFAEAEPHQQIFVGEPPRRSSLSSPAMPWPRGLHCGSQASGDLIADSARLAPSTGDAAMGAGTDAGIIVAAPIEQIVPRLRSGPRVI